MISNQRTVFFSAGLLYFVCAARAQTNVPSEPLAAPAQTVTGNVTLVSDYRFRGVSQSFCQLAINSGLDYTHSTGFCLGNWNSSVSSSSYNSGAGLAVDLYGGCRSKLPYAINRPLWFKQHDRCLGEFRCVAGARELQEHAIPGPELQRRSRQPAYPWPACRAHQRAPLQRPLLHGLQIVAGERIFWRDANAGAGR